MTNKEKVPANEQTFVSHLIELRDRLIRVLAAILIVFLCLFPFANDLYTLLADPLLRHLPENSTMIATEVASPFLTPFKLTLVLAFFVAIPIVLYQLWSFVAPGLYQNERKLVFPLVVSSVLLFYGGMAFAYYVVFPLVFGFLIGIAPEGVAVMTDISHYLNFVLKMFFAFGIAFEVPIATILLVWTGATTPKKLASKRPYIAVGAFVVAMLLTPPDIISQTLLAIPMLILFELGIIFSRFFVRKNEEGEKDENEEKNEKDDIDDDNQHKKTKPAAPAADTNTAHDDIDEDEHLRESDHKPMTEEEMDAELDHIEQEEQADERAEKESQDKPPKKDS
ncbi:MAG: twin-arginine translocase subunit TatC [Gammaproteobacteria bacterium]|nr:twin-arginine translocase subunit TatC [Gammaproteobacteria bacterium]